MAPFEKIVDQIRGVFLGWGGVGSVGPVQKKSKPLGSAPPLKNPWRRHCFHATTGVRVTLNHAYFTHISQSNPAFLHSTHISYMLTITVKC